MVPAAAMPYACVAASHWAAPADMRLRVRSTFALWVLAGLLALVSFGGCPSSTSGPSIARLPSLTSPDPQAELELREARAIEASGKTEEARARYEKFLIQRPK